MMRKVKLTCAADITPLPRAPCPFCGDMATARKCVPAHGSLFHEKRGVQVECMNCGARGPIYGDKESAFLGWKHGDPVRCDVQPNTGNKPRADGTSA